MTYGSKVVHSRDTYGLRDNVHGKEGVKARYSKNGGFGSGGGGEDVPATCNIGPH